jgi:hypothetical protein
MEVRAMATSQRWYFCLLHNTVEAEEGCRSADRLGPYATKEEATKALETAAQRTEDWDKDPRWNDDP